MKTEALSELHQARPFRPFVIHMADGRSFPIPHSEFLAYDPEGSVAIVLRSNGSFSILDLDSITELEAMAANGKKSGKSGK
jgi:hypothetical protein